MIETIQDTHMAIIIVSLLVIVCTGSRLVAWIAMRTHQGHGQDRRFDARMRRKLAEWGVQTAMAEGKHVPDTPEYTGGIVGADREAIMQEAREKIEKVLCEWKDFPEIQDMIVHEMLEERVRIVCSVPRFDRNAIPRMLRQRMILELQAMGAWLQERKAS